MPFNARAARRRPRLWSWKTIRRMLVTQGTGCTGAELDCRCRELARELNRLDDRSRHDAWRFAQRQRTFGLEPADDSGKIWRESA